LDPGNKAPTNYDNRLANWAEPLPANCPPKDARPPNGEEYFRLVNKIPPQESDFYSHRKLYPKKQFSTNECRARSVSLLRSHADCIMKMKLPRLRDKKIVSIALPPESGVVLKIGQVSHHSWWRAKHFDVLACCQQVMR
jgi:hypothetical protein